MVVEGGCRAGGERQAAVPGGVVGIHGGAGLGLNDAGRPSAAGGDIKGEPLGGQQQRIAGEIGRRRLDDFNRVAARPSGAIAVDARPQVEAVGAVGADNLALLAGQQALRGQIGASGIVQPQANPRNRLSGDAVVDHTADGDGQIALEGRVGSQFHELFQPGHAGFWMPDPERGDAIGKAGKKIGAPGVAGGFGGNFAIAVDHLHDPARPAALARAARAIGVVIGIHRALDRHRRRVRGRGRIVVGNPDPGGVVVAILVVAAADTDIGDDSAFRFVDGIVHCRNPQNRPAIGADPHRMRAVGLLGEEFPPVAHEQIHLDLVHRRWWRRGEREHRLLAFDDGAAGGDADNGAGWRLVVVGDIDARHRGGFGDGVARAGGEPGGDQPVAFLDLIVEGCHHHRIRAA